MLWGCQTFLAFLVDVFRAFFAGGGMVSMFYVQFVVGMSGLLVIRLFLMIIGLN